MPLNACIDGIDSDSNDIRWNGSVEVIIKKPDGTVVLEAKAAPRDTWRQGEYIRGKWGIYRGKDDQLRTGEDKVRFANFSITKGTAAPTSTCR